jgi:hypothetical protein
MPTPIVFEDVAPVVPVLDLQAAPGVVWGRFVIRRAAHNLRHGEGIRERDYLASHVPWMLWIVPHLNTELKLGNSKH